MNSFVNFKFLVGKMVHILKWEFRDVTRWNLHDDATCTTRRRVSASFEARLGKPSVTCFLAQQAVRSRRVSHAILPPSVLWRNRQTESCFVLRTK
jgi:hypothetical protein